MEEMDVPQRLDDHESRIQSLEAYRIEQEKQNAEISRKLSETENTVLKESGKQQEMTQKLLDHVLKTKSYAQQQFWKVAGAAVGAGGVIYLVIQAVVNKP
ncbi:hypothetical protein [Bacillus infantis]|uniref:hypothetical protein n=1 Tax=Bacillus infantis TaxID=324767 RepID=UPI003CF677B9